MICDECGQRQAEPGRNECYRCKITSIGFGFRGGGHLYGRENFSARTNAEYVAEHVGDVNRPGVAHLGSQEWQG
ncbi:MAG: hypothetical protein ABWX92_01165 [Mycetocola sp.]